MTLNQITSESAALWVDNPTNNSPSICFDYIFALLAEIGCPEIFPARKIAGSNWLKKKTNQPPRTSSFNIFHCFKFEPTERATAVVFLRPNNNQPKKKKKHIFHKCEHSKHQQWVSIKYELFVCLLRFLVNGWWAASTIRTLLCFTPVLFSLLASLGGFKLRPGIRWEKTWRNKSLNDDDWNAQKKKCVFVCQKTKKYDTHKWKTEVSHLCTRIFGWFGGLLWHRLTSVDPLLSNMTCRSGSVPVGPCGAKAFVRS